MIGEFKLYEGITMCIKNTMYYILHTKTYSLMPV